MKKIILVISACCWMLCAAAQTGDAVLNQRLKEFLQHTKELNAAGMLNYVYPRIFEIAPKEKLVSAMTSIMLSSGISILIDSIQLLGADKITVSGNTAFTRLQHLTEMRMRFPQEKGREDESAGYLELLQAQFGKDNVSYNGQDNYFKIRQAKYTLAIKDSYSKNKWTFVSQEQNRMLKKLLPAALVKKYKI